MELKRLRKGKNLTQAKLSELSGVSQSKISEYEAGKVEPRIEAVIRLSRALDCTLDELMGIEKKVS
jgi:transcriptional regulator with XRE-family HTH domain